MMKHQFKFISQNSSNSEPNSLETNSTHPISPPPSISKNSNVELKILNNNQLYGISRHNSSYHHQISSITSQHTADDTAHHVHHLMPSSCEEKSKMTRLFLIVISAITYAIFLVVFGAIAFIGNALTPLWPAPQIFCIFILFVSSLYFIFLLIHIRLHVMKTKKIQHEKEKKMQQNEDNVSMASSGVTEVAPHAKSYSFTNCPNHNYCFVTGRHGELLYLKLGAAWFCFGLLIHSILALSYEIVYILQNSECADILQLIVDVMFPLYSLFILFFIFKYCNVVINCHQSVARILLMHAIGMTLALWIYSVVNETVSAIELKRMAEYPNSTEISPNLTPRLFFKPHDSQRAISVNCPGPEELNLIYRYIEPYLYPFVIEFCILTVGIYYMMWANINNCPSRNKKAENQEESMVFSSLESIPEAINIGMRRRRVEEIPGCRTMRTSHEEQIKSSLVVYADCHASSRGLFAGMILMIFKIVSMILVHVTASAEDYSPTMVLVDRSIEFATLLILIITTIIAYIKTSKFDINQHPVSKLDDVLLFIAIPAFFSETIFSLVPAVYNTSIINILVISSQLIQVLIQTPWIIDALRRCSNSPELRRLKPGRELVTFLTIANVALWIYYTFTIKTSSVRDERYDFYGDKLWSILNHLSLPLIMFYRFHASVCLVDVWKHSYERGEEGGH